jgi:hypothetical protein
MSNSGPTGMWAKPRVPSSVRVMCARREALPRAVVELDLADAGDHEDELALRRAVLVMDMRGRGIAEEQAQRGKVRRGGPAAAIGLQRHVSPLDARFAVIAGEDPGYDHEDS